MLTDGENDAFFEFKAKFFLGGVHFVEFRQRYNVWDLLGDVGGFHDGVILIFSLFMGPYSALAFKLDYFSSTAIDRESLAGNTKKKRRTKAYAAQSESI